MVRCQLWLGLTITATIVSSLASASAIATANISNAMPRVDQFNVPLNAHQGSLIRGSGTQSETYYYYGGHFPNCTHAEHCTCADTGKDIWNGVAVYSSRDLTHWDFLRVLLGAGAFEPRVMFNPTTSEYVIVVTGCAGCRLTVATSLAPAGDFKVVGCLDLSEADLLSDWNVFRDPNTHKGYVIYNSKSAPGQFIEELTADYRHVVAGSQPTHIAADVCEVGGCEAPAMFERDGIYYALFGHNCWCCVDGADLLVYVSPSPLGPYTFRGDANTDGMSKVVHGQSAGVLPINTTDGMQYLWLSDRWQSTTLWSTDFQYWGLLQFSAQGDILPLTWQENFQLQLA